MEVQEVLQKRRSVRRYTEEEVTKEEIEKLLHAAMSGPSACNAMPWEFYVVTDKETLNNLKGASKYTGIDAPLAIIVAGNLKKALPMQLSPFWIQDCSAATENILLCATDMGLGTVWCGIHPQLRAEDKVRKILDMPKSHIPLNIIYVGRPAEEPLARDQYDIEKVHFI